MATPAVHYSIDYGCEQTETKLSHPPSHGVSTLLTSSDWVWVQFIIKLSCYSIPAPLSPSEVPILTGFVPIPPFPHRLLPRHYPGSGVGLDYRLLIGNRNGLRSITVYSMLLVKACSCSLPSHGPLCAPSHGLLCGQDISPSCRCRSF